MRVNHGEVGERGAAAVEFAFVAMLLVTLLMGIMEFGYAFFAQGTIAGSAREAARYYAIHHQEADASTKAAAAAHEALGVLDPAKVVIAPFGCASGAGGDDAVTVTITYDFEGGLTGFFPLIPDLKATGTMRCSG